MTDKLEQTQALLEKHHRDGAVFAQLMKETFTSRFNDTFWEYWESNIWPGVSKSPVILDLGTGPGVFLQAVAQRFPGAKLYGVECATYMLEAMNDLPKSANIIEADLHNPKLPLDDSFVDVSIASMVLHEMHQPIKALMEVHRCLKPGALLYILDWVRVPLANYLADSEIKVFDKNTPADQLEDLFVHFIEHNRFTLDDLVFMLQHLNFEVIDQSLLNQGRHARILARKK